MENLSLRVVQIRDRGGKFMNMFAINLESKAGTLNVSSRPIKMMMPNKETTKLTY